ncbi:MAG: NUDIX domain-containing protein [Candidatus Diapherotrites archaeon]|nr:NUDIX domain-containing protein [Candidatus Diapherotrites archaeon]
MSKLVRHFTAGTFIVHQSKVLLILHRKLNKWLPPGGHVDENELPDQCALREAKEEVGLKIKLISFANHLPKKFKTTKVLVQPFHVNVHQISKNHEHVGFVFFGKPIGKPKIKMNKKEIVKASWFSEKDLVKLKNLPDDVLFSANQAIEWLKWFHN